MAHAVVVILTAEDEARLTAQFANGGAEPLAGQPRQNVTLEAGMAMGVAPERTILVQLGTIRGASDFEGLNVVRLTNDPEQRSGLRTRLRNAGCAVNDAGEDWLRSPIRGDFEAVVLGSGEVPRTQEAE